MNTSKEETSEIPRYKGEFGGQYLSPSGWFVQPAVGIIGPRLKEYIGNPPAPRERREAFMITNLRVGKRSGLHTTVYVEGINLFNERTVIQAKGEQLLPGRLWRFGITKRF